LLSIAGFACCQHHFNRATRTKITWLHFGLAKRVFQGIESTKGATWTNLIMGEIVYEYRDDSEGFSMVRRDQLWNTFGVVSVLHPGTRLDVPVSR
jgi:hypothetical protein